MQVNVDSIPPHLSESVHQRIYEDMRELAFDEIVTDVPPRLVGVA
jgi:hypothetical protein